MINNGSEGKGERWDDHDDGKELNHHPYMLFFFSLIAYFYRHWVKISSRNAKEGLDQLKNAHGQARVGDIVQVHTLGEVIPLSTEKRGCCCVFRPDYEFIDSINHNKRTTFEIKSDSNEYQGLYRGLNEAVKTMIFGEEATFIIPATEAFGAEGLSRANAGSTPKADHKDRNPTGISFRTILPNQDLKVEVIFLRLYRDGKWYNRKRVNKPNIFNAGWDSSM